MPHMPLPLKDYWQLVQPIMADAAEQPRADPIVLVALVAVACVWISLLTVAAWRRLERRHRQRALAAASTQ